MAHIVYDRQDTLTIFDDIVSQSVNKFYKKNHKVLITDNPFLSQHNDAIPQSYQQECSAILGLLNPHNISSNGTALMIINAFNNYTCGGYMQIKSQEKRKGIVLHDKISKLIRNADTFGSCLVLKNFDNGSYEIIPKHRFYFNEKENRVYVSKNIILDGQDVVEHKVRYLKGKKLIEETSFSNGSESVVTTATPFSGEEQITKLGAFTFYSSIWEEDITGESVLDPVVESIKTFEVMQHYSNQSVLFSKPRIFIPSEMIEYDENGEPVIDTTNDIFTPTDAVGQDSNMKMDVVQFDIKAEEFGRKKDDDFEMILSKVGLGSNVRAGGSNVGIEKSAKEVISESSTMFATVEMRRIRFYPQILNFIEFVGGSGVEVSFLPLQFMDFTTTAQTLTMMKSVGAISNEMLVALAHPRLVGTDAYEEEVARLYEIDNSKEVSKENKNVIEEQEEVIGEKNGKE